MSQPWTTERTARLFKALDSHLDDATALRRRIHAEPRLGGDEQHTTDVIVSALGLPSQPVAGTGALVRVGDPVGPTVGLRAELDALPVEERNDLPWRSTNAAMHACGHDVHMAAAFAVAKAVQDEGGPLPLLLVLQPREETYPSGAKDVTLSPEFAIHDVRAFIGAHVQPRLADGEFSAVPGPVNAAADEFTIRVNGRPGHAAYPHLTADPVVAAADLIGTLQHLISRQVDPTNPTVLTVGSITGGNSPNVVPSAVRMDGILRTFDERDRVRLHAAIESTATAVCEVHGCDAEVQISLGAPVLDNDLTLAATAGTWIEHTGLVQGPPLRSCGADDFSFYSPLVPSLMVFVGVGSGGPEVPGLHRPDFLPPDRTVGDVARAMLAAYLGGCSTVDEISLPERD
ncbi:MAG TPA: M20 family metallopeptidase [Nocardioidaceae bacterium]